MKRTQESRSKSMNDNHYLYKRGKRLSLIVNKNNSKRYNIFKESHKPLWIPSQSSFFIIFVACTFIFAISHVGVESKWGPFLTFEIFNSLNIPVIKSDSTTYQNLISVNAGIVSVLVGLAFFVAQSLMDKEDPDKAKVLLYKSMFFPLLTCEVGIFLILLTGDLNYFICLAVGVLGFLVMISLGRTIEILIRANDLEKSKIVVFVDILKRNFVRIMDDEITRRMSLNKFFEVGEEFGDKYSGSVSFTPFGAYNKEKYLKIKSPLKGTIIDVDFINLELLIDDVVRSIPFDSELTANLRTDIGATTDTTPRDKLPLVYVVTMPYSSVKQGSTLLEIDKSALVNNSSFAAKFRHQRLDITGLRIKPIHHLLENFICAL